LRTALRAMKRHGGGKSIVLTSSVAGLKPTAQTAAYGSSKAAVAHLAQIAAAEHLGDGIRINAVAPGRVDTPIWTKTDSFKQLVEDLGSREAALQAAGEQAGGQHVFATAEQLARQIGFLLSDTAANITGTVLVSDGGYRF
jgi:2-keto-3-deoxy-L-fuconate dehydrogenase